MSSEKRILFITPYPFANAPSQRFRFEQYLAILKKNGFEVNIESFLSEKSWKLLYNDSGSATKFGAILFGYLKRINFLFCVPKSVGISVRNPCSSFPPKIKNY